MICPTMSSSLSVCPVPAEQRPINEYRSLKEAWFFHWLTLALPPYLKRISCLWTLSWVVTGPIAAASFPLSEYPLKFGLMASISSSVLVSLFLLRVYLGWAYIRDRLISETVFYEESGWYDGQYWTKPTEELTRDRLVGNYEILPMLKRLIWTFSGLGLLVFAEAILWRLLLA